MTSVPADAMEGYTPFPLAACPIRLTWKTPVDVRFWCRVLPLESGCWQWLGALDGGYGLIGVDHEQIYVHRYAYEVMVGPIPDGKVIDHLCRQRSCVNPRHLEVVDPGENTKRGFGAGMKNAAKTHCPNGHELTPRPIGRGRECVPCMQQIRRNWEGRQRAKGLVRFAGKWMRPEDVPQDRYWTTHEWHQHIGRLSGVARRARSHRKDVA